MNKHIVLTVSLLISNRPDTVRKCLDSVSPLLEQVPSELILVDTGCGEEVRGIAEEYTDRIVRFQWCRDFSKARNAGLKLAKGEWFLYLDDDEWFEDVTDIVRFFRTGEYRAYGVGLYTQRNYLSFDGTEYAELLVSRMIRLEPDIKFIYKIHECFNRAPGPVKKLKAYVHHYGYVYQSKEDRELHALRNISLLLEELEEQPRNMKHVLQLVQEYNSIDERVKSLQLSVDSISKAERGPVEGEYCLASLYANEINCYIELGYYEDAISRGEQHLRSRRPDRMAKALISGRLTTAYLEEKNYEKCLERAKYYWDVYQEFQRDTDAFMEYDTPVTSTCFHPQRLAQILGNGIRAALRLGDDELVWKWFQGIGWKGNKAYVDSEVIREILERMVVIGEKGQGAAGGTAVIGEKRQGAAEGTAVIREKRQGAAGGTAVIGEKGQGAAEGAVQREDGRMPAAGENQREHYRQMCDTLLEHGEWKDYVLQVIMENCGRGDTIEDRIRIAAVYKDAASEHWFLKLVRLAAGAFGIENIGPEKVEHIAGEIWSAMEESLPWMEAYDLPEALRLLGGDNRRVIEGIPFRRWEKGIRAYLGRQGWEGSLWWTERLEETLEPDDIRILAWRAVRGASLADGEAAMRRRISGIERFGGAAKLRASTASEGAAKSESSVRAADGTAGESRMDKIFKGLREFASCRTALCERIYRTEIIRGMPDLLPEEDRGAYAVLALLEQAEEGRYAEAVGTVREIKDLLPGFAGIMKRCIKWLEDRIDRQEEERKRESAKAAVELQALGRQVKAQIYAMVQAGQYQAALSVVEQLQALLPGDEELQRLREQICRKL